MDVDVDVDLGFSKCTCCYASARSRCTLEHFANKLTNFFSHHLATLGTSNHHTVSFYRLVVATFFPPLYSTQSLFPREIDCIVRFFFLFFFISILCSTVGRHSRGWKRARNHEPLDIDSLRREDTTGKKGGLFPWHTKSCGRRIGHLLFCLYYARTLSEPEETWN